MVCGKRRFSMMGRLWNLEPCLCRTYLSRDFHVSISPAQRRCLDARNGTGCGLASRNMPRTLGGYKRITGSESRRRVAVGGSRPAVRIHHPAVADMLCCLLTRLCAELKPSSRSVPPPTARKLAITHSMIITQLRRSYNGAVTSLRGSKRCSPLRLQMHHCARCGMSCECCGSEPRYARSR